MDGTSLAASTVAKEGSFQGGEGRGQRQVLVRLGGLQKLTVDFCFRRLWMMGSEERMRKLSLRML